MEQPLAEPPRTSPDAGTPSDDFDGTLGRAIEAGRLEPSQATDSKLAGAFAAHQKLESLFALLRGGPAIEPEPAPTHFGRYEVRSIIGAGAFGTVYLARDPELNRDVAIKVSNPLLYRERAREREDRMAAEARHAAGLNHPNIVAIYDVGRENDRLYIVMEYVPGRTLAELMSEGPDASAGAVELPATVADALHYAHKRGFVHRDLKPANILLDEQGRPHVADFGLAVSEETQRTLAGQIAGTPAYIYESRAVPRRRAPPRRPRRYLELRCDRL